MHTSYGTVLNLNDYFSASKALADALSTIMDKIAVSIEILAEVVVKALKDVTIVAVPKELEWLPYDLACGQPRSKYVEVLTDIKLKLRPFELIQKQVKLNLNILELSRLKVFEVKTVSRRVDITDAVARNLLRDGSQYDRIVDLLPQLRRIGLVDDYYLVVVRALPNQSTVRVYKVVA